MRSALFVFIAALSLPALGTVTGAPSGFFGGIPGAQAAPLQASCSVVGYSHNSVVCAVVPSHGTFTIKIPKNGGSLKGKGSSSIAGTQITIIRVPAPVASKGGFGLRVRATGKFGSLKMSKGTVYKYNAAKNSLGKVSAITGNGIYQVVH